MGKQRTEAGLVDADHLGKVVRLAADDGAEARHDLLLVLNTGLVSVNVQLGTAKRTARFGDGLLIIGVSWTCRRLENSDEIGRAHV